MHPCIQVKTKLLPGQASCLPGKQPVRMCVSTEPRGRHSVHKAQADETDDTMSEHASFHAWLCSHKREKDSSNYRELRLLHWPPPAASCKVLIHESLQQRIPALPGRMPSLIQPPKRLASARQEHSTVPLDLQLQCSILILWKPIKRVSSNASQWGGGTGRVQHMLSEAQAVASTEQAANLIIASLLAQELLEQGTGAN